MGHLLNVYLAKVKIVLGAFKASKINLLLIFIYLLGVVSGGFGLGLAVTEDVRKGTVLSVYIDELSALISLGIAIAIIASFRGFIIFDYEESLFFTSTITPWVFSCRQHTFRLNNLLDLFQSVFCGVRSNRCFSTLASHDCALALCSCNIAYSFPSFS